MIHLVRTSALLTILVALSTLGLVAPGSAATTTGAVKGVITLDGKPLKGLRVELHPTGDDGYDFRTLAVDTTDSKGAYSFTFSTAGPDYYGNTIIIRDPSRIVATSRTFMGRAGKTVTRNASVKPAASITGTVKRSDARPTQRLRVDVFGPSAQVDPHHESVTSDVYDEQVRVAEDGSFALRGLPAGDYYLGFVDEGKTYAPQCYDNTMADDAGCDGSFESAVGAQQIRVATGQKVTLNPQVLSSTGARISGTVTDTSGRPIKYADVTAVRDGQDGRLGAESSAKGSFTIGPLTDGRYRLSVEPLSPWAPQTVADPIDIAGKDVKDLAIRLKSRAKVKATLTPGTGTVTVAVDVTRSATGSKPSGKTTIRWGTVAKTISLVKGKASAKLSGLPEGKRQITVAYAGTASTAATTKLFYATVK